MTGIHRLNAEDRVDLHQLAAIVLGDAFSIFWMCGGAVWMFVTG